MTVRVSHLAFVACIAIAFFVGVGFGRARTERAVAMAIKAAKERTAKATAEAPVVKKDKGLEPRTHYKGGKVVGRDLYDPKTGTVTALPVDDNGSEKGNGG